MDRKLLSAEHVGSSITTCQAAETNKHITAGSLDCSPAPPYPEMVASDAPRGVAGRDDNNVTAGICRQRDRPV